MERPELVRTCIICHEDKPRLGRTLHNKELVTHDFQPLPLPFFKIGASSKGVSLTFDCLGPIL